MLNTQILPLPPGKTIGILGGGQLGRMLSVAAGKLGLKTHIYCPDEDSPAFAVSNTHTLADYEDTDALTRFAKSVDVITYEFENIPYETLQALSAQIPIYPDPDILKITQDRLHEKSFLNTLGILTTPFADVTSKADLETGFASVGPDVILKTRRLGYDGKGQSRVKSLKEAHAAWDGVNKVDSLLEKFVPFTCEISVITARNIEGKIACYDPGLNIHANHILDETHIPCNAAQNTVHDAILTASRIVRELDYIGVMGVEFFIVEEAGQEKLYVNEIAPRVHNSGHWTMDACLTDQFEQHIRAVAGWPLGSTERHSDVVMKNLIGHDVENWAEFCKQPHSALHLYGKKEMRAGRKMGHVNTIKPLMRD